MIKKLTAACLVAAMVGFAGPIKAVVLTSEWDRKYWFGPHTPERSPSEEAAADSGDLRDRLPEVMAIKPPPIPKAFPPARPNPKPQPTPKPTPLPPGATPSPGAGVPGKPKPTPPITRPTHP